MTCIFSQLWVYDGLCPKEFLGDNVTTKARLRQSHSNAAILSVQRTFHWKRLASSGHIKVVAKISAVGTLIIVSSMPPYVDGRTLHRFGMSKMMFSIHGVA